MRRARTVAACLGVLLLLTLTTSARADSLRAQDMVVKLKNNQGENSNVSDVSKSGAFSFFAELFEDNNGLHLGLLKNDNGLHLGLLKNSSNDVEFENNSGKRLGFTVASTNPGNKFGLFQGPQSPQSSAGAIPNPEPAAVFLLGTGLAAAGAFARRRFRKSGD